MATAQNEWSPLLLQIHPSASLWLYRLSDGLSEFVVLFAEPLVEGYSICGKSLVGKHPIKYIL